MLPGEVHHAQVERGTASHGLAELAAERVDRIRDHDDVVPELRLHRTDGRVERRGKCRVLELLHEGAVLDATEQARR